MDANHKEKESVNVLRECIELQLNKSQDINTLGGFSNVYTYDKNT